MVNNIWYKTVVTYPIDFRLKNYRASLMIGLIFANLLKKIAYDAVNKVGYSSRPYLVGHTYSPRSVNPS